MLYFIFHWISSVYETCGVSLFFISSSTIFNNNIMKNKPKKSLRMIIRQFLSRVIVTFEAMFELSCNIATIMTGLNFKSRIQIKVVFLVGHLKWQIVRIRILILIHFYIKQGIAVIFHFFSFNFFQKLINVPLCLFWEYFTKIIEL